MCFPNRSGRKVSRRRSPRARLGQRAAEKDRAVAAAEGTDHSGPYHGGATLPAAPALIYSGSLRHVFVRMSGDCYLARRRRAGCWRGGSGTVAAGDALLSPTVTKRVIRQFVRAPRATPPPELDELTPREQEIFPLIARGLSNAQIGEELFIGETTVKTHITHIFQKLNLRDRVQAVVLADQTRNARGRVRYVRTRALLSLARHLDRKR